MISITFDDGWKNQYINAVPVLRTYGFRATFYVITQMMQKRMTPHDWKLLSQEGHEIGAHSQTHPHLQICLPGKVQKEINGSKKDIENLGIPTTTFAYPFGRKNWYIIKQVKAAGFKGARLYDGKINEIKKYDPFRLHCVQIYSHTSLFEIENILDKNPDKWIIFGFHQIEENPPHWGVTPEFFEKFCHLIAQKNIPVKTVRDVLQSRI